MTALYKKPNPRLARKVHQDALRKLLIDLTTHPTRRHKSRAIVGLSLVLASAGSSAAIAATYEHFKAVTNTSMAHCYTLPSIGNSGADVTVVGAPSSPAQVNDAIGTCRVLWQDGFLSLGISGIIRVTQPTTLHPAPSLVVCTLPNGIAGVFPGNSSTCELLGLPDAKPAG